MASKQPPGTWTVVFVDTTNKVQVVNVPLAVASWDAIQQATQGQLVLQVVDVTLSNM